MIYFSVIIYGEPQDNQKKIVECFNEIAPESKMEFVSRPGELLEKLDSDDVWDLILINLDQDSQQALELIRKIHQRNVWIPVAVMSDEEDFYKKAFEVYAFDYIRKPVSKEALKHVLYPVACRKNYVRDEGSVHFRYRSRLYSFRYNQILYVSSSLHMVSFYLTDGSVVDCRGKLNDFTDQLDPEVFLRCHQSFFVNMGKITAMKNDSFLLGTHEIPISRSYIKDAHERYQAYIQRKFI